MTRIVLITSVAALLAAANPALAAATDELTSTAMGSPTDHILVAQQNQNRAGGPQVEQEQEQNQEQTQNEEQNQNQNQGDGNGNGGGPPTLTREQVTQLDGYVCFFADAEFAGEAFCTGPQGYSNALGNVWNDRISSIEIVGEMDVTVCTDPELKGTCQDFGENAETLPAELDDKISSWKVKE